MVIVVIKLFATSPGGIVALQITSVGYRTEHGQAIRTELMEEFVLPTWTCSMCANSPMNSVWIA